VKVRQGAREAGDINAETAENNALLTAYGYKAQSQLDTATSQQAAIGGDLGALGAAASLYGKWAAMQDPSGGDAATTS
jgi:hypothetical protein